MGDAVQEPEPAPGLCTAVGEGAGLSLDVLGRRAMLAEVVEHAHDRGRDLGRRRQSMPIDRCAARRRSARSPCRRRRSSHVRTGALAEPADEGVLDDAAGRAAGGDIAHGDPRPRPCRCGPGTAGRGPVRPRRGPCAPHRAGRVAGRPGLAAPPHGRVLPREPGPGPLLDRVGPEPAEADLLCAEQARGRRNSAASEAGPEVRGCGLRPPGRGCVAPAGSGRAAGRAAMRSRTR